MDLGVTETLVPIPDLLRISQVPAWPLTSSGIQGRLFNFWCLSFLICGVGTIIEPISLHCYEY